MTIEFVVDNRERKLIELLQETSDVKVEQLPVGDILFREDGETILIIERKTVADLKASICDGRGREQKARLLGSTPTERIMYLIEGSLDRELDSKISGLPTSTLLGSLINTQLRDGIKVYKTSTLHESACFLRKLHDKLGKDGEKYFKESSQGNIDTKYTATLHKTKKANMTARVWFTAQLALIPQVTEKVAEKIIEHYPTPVALVLEYEKTPEHLRPKLLADITFPLKSGKSRRVGDKMSQRIHQFFYDFLV